jgi:malonyl CoA-acyl carrier protein transacylase
MMKILSGFNIVPEASAGHSYGELTALCAGKRISEMDFLRLSIWRGRLMAAAAGEDKGQMLAVKADLERIEQLLKNSGVDVVLANRNGPEQGVLSGNSHEIEKMIRICKENRIRAMLLPVSAAFHSRLVSDAAEGFREKIETVDILPASIPVYSNKTAMPYPVEEADVRRLFGEHLISPVNFMDQIQRMHADGVNLFIEVGPKNALTGLVNAILKGRSISVFFS